MELMYVGWPGNTDGTTVGFKSLLFTVLEDRAFNRVTLESVVESWKSDGTK